MPSSEPWCPIDPVLHIASAKWTIPILRILYNGARRPSELSKALKGINPKILTERLRDLEKWGLINRKEYKEIPPRVEYSLTVRGHDLINVVAHLKAFGERWQSMPGIEIPAHVKEQCTHCLGGNEYALEEPSSALASSKRGILQIDTAKVYFIGAGPGPTDLITVRGARILSEVSTVLYSGTLAPEAVLTYCSPDAELIDIDNFALEEQIECYSYAKEKSLSLARVYSGDPAIFGSIAEQIEVLNELDIEYEIVPGISFFTAASARLGCSLSRSSLIQCIILTRLSARASKDQDFERIEYLASQKTTMCIYLSSPHFVEAVTRLSKHYSANTPIALLCRPGEPDERKYIGTLATILDQINPKDWTTTTMMIVGDSLKWNNCSNSIASISQQHASEVVA